MRIKVFGVWWHLGWNSPDHKLEKVESLKPELDDPAEIFDEYLRRTQPNRRIPSIPADPRIYESGTWNTEVGNAVGHKVAELQRQSKELEVKKQTAKFAKMSSKDAADYLANIKRESIKPSSPRDIGGWEPGMSNRTIGLGGSDTRLIPGVGGSGGGFPGHRHSVSTGYVEGYHWVDSGACTTINYMKQMVSVIGDCNSVVGCANINCEPCNEKEFIV